MTMGNIFVGLGNIGALLTVLYYMRKNKGGNSSDNGTKERVDKHTEEIGIQTDRVNVLSDKVVIHGEKIARVEAEVEHAAEEIAGLRKENREDHNRIYEAIEARNGRVT
jgi:hypothetical protein